MYTRLLVSTDGSELAGRGVTHAIALAAKLGAKLLVLTASEPWNNALLDPSGLVAFEDYQRDYAKAADTQAQTLLAAATGAAAAQGVEAEGVHVPGRLPADAILETAQARGCDLIVMASHGRRGLGRVLLGSQTQAVLAHGTVPVLVVR